MTVSVLLVLACCIAASPVGQAGTATTTAAAATTTTSTSPAGATTAPPTVPVVDRALDNPHNDVVHAGKDSNDVTPFYAESSVPEPVLQPVEPLLLGPGAALEPNVATVPQHGADGGPTPPSLPSSTPAHRRGLGGPRSSTPSTFPSETAGAWGGAQGQLDVRNLMLANRYRRVLLQLPLSAPNIIALVVLASLSVLGVVFLFRQLTERKCTCPLCSKEYIIEHKLGAGGFGAVFVVHPFDEVDHKLVMKQVSVANLNAATDAQEEAKDLRMLKHDRIVKYADDFLHYVHHGFGRDELHVCIVMEYCNSDVKRLITRVRRLGQIVPEDQVLKLLVQLAEALRYCHAQGIIHRDIKPQNVFLTSSGDIRLGDFGLSRQVKRPWTSYTNAGTDCYKSPETLLGGRRDGRKADVWGMGLLLHEVVTLRLAWEHPNSLGANLLSRGVAALDEFIALVPREQYSPGLISLLKHLLHPDPKARPTMEEVLRCKYVKQGINGLARSFRSQMRTFVRHDRQKPHRGGKPAGGLPPRAQVAAPKSPRSNAFESSNAHPNNSKNVPSAPSQPKAAGRRRRASATSSPSTPDGYDAEWYGAKSLISDQWLRSVFQTPVDGSEYNPHESTGTSSHRSTSTDWKAMDPSSSDSSQGEEDPGQESEQQDDEHEDEHELGPRKTSPQHTGGYRKRGKPAPTRRRRRLNRAPAEASQKTK